MPAWRSPSIPKRRRRTASWRTRGLPRRSTGRFQKGYPKGMSARPVKDMWKSQPTIEGAGVHLKRAFGGQRHVVDFDPFLLMDDFRCEDPNDFLAGFPWHPHRGMETITYVLDGDVEHQDSLGNGGV